MRQVFADTSFYLALIIPHDRHHKAAREFMRQYRETIITSECVLIETASHLSRIRFKHLFRKLYEGLIRHSFTVVRNSSPELWNASLDLYNERSDKDWSFTDCSSLVLMREGNINEVLTTDHHFVQAGMMKLL